jgi:hypothetical protein
MQTYKRSRRISAFISLLGILLILLLLYLINLGSFPG